MSAWPYAHRDPSIKAFMDACCEQNLKEIQSQINGGFDVTQPYDKLGQHPVWDMITSHLMERSPNDEKTRRIVEAVLLAATPALNLEAEIIRRPRADRETATLLLAAIMGSRGAPLDIGLFFAGIGDPASPYHPSRVEEMERVARVHEIVRQRLLNPGTELEQRASLAMSKEGALFWKNPFQTPDLATLPIPSQERINRCMRLMEDAQDTLQTNKGNSRPQGYRVCTELPPGVSLN